MKSKIVPALGGLLAVLALASASASAAASASVVGVRASHTVHEAMPGAASKGRSHTWALPRGAHLAKPPRPGAGLRGMHSQIAADSIGCYDHESILSAANDRWVSAELGYGTYYAMLRARGSAIGPWEQFALCYDYTSNYWFIDSDANGLGVSAELSYGTYYAMLRARATVIGPWEQYVLACTTSGTLIIGSLANNRWVSAELGYGTYYAMLRARATAIGPWEQYYTYTGRVGC